MISSIIILSISSVIIGLSIYYKKSRFLRQFGWMLSLGGSALILMAEFMDRVAVNNLAFSIAVGVVCWLVSISIKKKNNNHWNLFIFNLTLTSGLFTGDTMNHSERPMTADAARRIYRSEKIMAS